MNEVLRRFLGPTHALNDGYISDKAHSGQAETPGEDARCRVILEIDDNGCIGAAFSVFGPPETIACADWVCEYISGQYANEARPPVLRDLERALALTPVERYAGSLAIDALANAMVNLGR